MTTKTKKLRKNQLVVTTHTIGGGCGDPVDANIGDTVKIAQSKFADSHDNTHYYKIFANKADEFNGRMVWASSSKLKVATAAQKARWN